MTVFESPKGEMVFRQTSASTHALAAIALSSALSSRCVSLPAAGGAAALELEVEAEVAAVLE